MRTFSDDTGTHLLDLVVYSTNFLVPVKMLFRTKPIVMSSMCVPIFVLTFAATLFDLRYATPALLLFVQLPLDNRQNQAHRCTFQPDAC